MLEQSADVDATHLSRFARRIGLVVSVLDS